MTWVDGPVAFSPSWSGTVTSVAVQPSGIPVRSGDNLVQVDGVWRVAALTLTPFYRPLEPGSRGSDVAALNAFLRDLGFKAGDGETWSRSTTQGVAQLAERVGAGRASGFDPGWVVWIPSQEFIVASVEAETGAPAPSNGEPILLSAPVASNASIRDDGGGLESITGDDWIIEVGDVSVPYSGDPSHAVGDPSSTLLGMTRSDEPVDATLRRSTALPVVQVPPSALVSAGGGRYCVWSVEEADSPRTEWKVSSVEIVGGELGVTLVSDEGIAGKFVVGNPNELGLDEVEC